jgi:hypothetical protein
LESTPDGRLAYRLAYRLKTPWRDGTTHVLMERCELLERLAPLIPPPRAHQVRYHGVLAPCASGRNRVVPQAVAGTSEAAPTSNPKREASRAGTAELDVPGSESHGPLLPNGTIRLLEVPDQAGHRTPSEPNEEPAPSGSLPFPAKRCYAWADLLQRVFEVDALRCPDCGSRMRILAAITDPAVARRILECVELPARAPPLAAPLAAGRAFSSQLDAPYDEAEPFEFDQSPPSDWDLGA